MMEAFGIEINWLHGVLVILLAWAYMDRLYYKDMVYETIEELEEIADRKEGERE